MKGILFLIGLTLGLIIGLGIAVYQYESKKNNNVNKAIYIKLLDFNIRNITGRLDILKS